MNRFPTLTFFRFWLQLLAVIVLLLVLVGGALLATAHFVTQLEVQPPLVDLLVVGPLWRAGLFTGVFLSVVIALVLPLLLFAELIKLAQSVEDHLFHLRLGGGPGPAHALPPAAPASQPAAPPPSESIAPPEPTIAPDVAATPTEAVEPAQSTKATQPNPLLDPDAREALGTVNDITETLPPRSQREEARARAIRALRLARERYRDRDYQGALVGIRHALEYDPSFEAANRALEIVTRRLKEGAGYKDATTELNRLVVDDNDQEPPTTSDDTRPHPPQE